MGLSALSPRQISNGNLLGGSRRPYEIYRRTIYSWLHFFLRPDQTSRHQINQIKIVFMFIAIYVQSIRGGIIEFQYSGCRPVNSSSRLQWITANFPYYTRNRNKSSAACHKLNFPGLLIPFGSSSIRGPSARSPWTS